MFPKNLDEESDDGSNADSDFSGDDAGGAKEKKKKGEKGKKSAGGKKTVTKKDSIKEVKPTTANPT